MKWVTKLVAVVARRVYVVFELPLEWRAPSLAAPDQPACRPVCADESIIQALFREDLDRAQRFLAFLADGYIGAFHVCGEQWASYAWMAVPDTRRPPHLPSRDVPQQAYWIHFCRTADQFQGRGLYKRSLVMLAQRARQQDPSGRVLIDADSGNVAARKAMLAVGFEPRGVISTQCLGIPRVTTFVRGSWRVEAAHPAIPVPTAAAGRAAEETLT